MLAVQVISKDIHACHVNSFVRLKWTCTPLCCCLCRDVVFVLFSFQHNSKITFLSTYNLTVITRGRAAVIKISVAVPSDIPRITNACVIIDTVDAATFKK